MTQKPTVVQQVQGSLYYKALYKQTHTNAQTNTSARFSIPKLELSQMTSELTVAVLMS